MGLILWSKGGVLAMAKQHTWPYSKGLHPVGDKHKIKGELAKNLDVPEGTEVHGEETGSISYFYKKTKYKEGE